MRLRAAGPAALLLVLAACKGGGIHGAVDDLTTSIRDLLGAETLPGRYVDQIAAAHESETTWRFREDANRPLETTCEAVRLLAAADYGTWREAAFVTRLLTTMADEHPSSLVRVECLDALTKMFAWTSAAVTPPARRPPSQDVERALARISEARKDATRSPESAAAVAEALDTVAAFRFDETAELPAKLDLRALSRGSREQLVTARRLLRSLTGGVLEGYDADPRVREATDRALVSTSAAAMRLALISAATGAAEPIVRSTAVRNLERARPDSAARILSAVVTSDQQSSVRLEAARALGRFEPEQCVPALLAALGDDRYDVRAVAAASLAASTGQSFGDDRRAWAAWWQERSRAAPAPPDASAK